MSTIKNNDTPYSIGEKVKVKLTMDSRLSNGGRICSDEKGNDYFINYSAQALAGMKEGETKEVIVTIKDYYRFHDGWKTYDEMKKLYPHFMDKRYVVGKIETVK